MLQHLLGEGQPKVGLFVVGVVGDAGLGVWNGQPVILEFDMGEGSVGVVDGHFALGDSGSLVGGKFDGLGVAVHGLLEVVVLELVVALLLALLAFN